MAETEAPARTCPVCGEPYESWSAEPYREAPDGSGLLLVTLSVATTFQPCGHGQMKATGDSL